MTVQLMLTLQAALSNNASVPVSGQDTLPVDSFHFHPKRIPRCFSQKLLKAIASLPHPRVNAMIGILTNMFPTPHYCTTDRNVIGFYGRWSAVNLLQIANQVSNCSLHQL